MPIYEYQCLGCGERIEKLQKFSEAPLKTCKKCGGELKKLISQTSFILKGSGWYKTDYAKKEFKKEIPQTPPCKAKEEGSCAQCPAAKNG